MGFLYHGSSAKNLKTLEPHNSTHGTYVYATPYKELATIFSGRAGDDLTYSLFRYSEEEPWQLVERVPIGFDITFSNSASIYTLDDASFKDIKTGFAELVSEVSVDVISEEKLEKVYSKLDSFDEEGLIKIYRYPNRPKSIPEDDSDLLSKTIYYIEKSNKPPIREDFIRLLFLHPNLLEKVNSFCLSKIDNFVPFKKEDLIDIFKVYVERQIKHPDKEYFIESAKIQICNTYPELRKNIDELIIKAKKNGLYE